jgi:CheY-like chemotaxis protein
MVKHMKSRTILLVEDDHNDVVLIRNAFLHWGVSDHLQVVTGGRLAMDYLAGRGMYSDRVAFPFPKLVLMDLRLPDMSGFDVLKWLRSEPGLAKVPVVILTGSEVRADIDHAYHLGANSYLVKTPDPDKFQALVQDLNEFVLRPRDPDAVINLGKPRSTRNILAND